MSFGHLQFLDGGQVFETAQAEEFEEVLGCPVKHGAADILGPADDLHHAEFAQAIKDLADGHAANRLDLGADDGLFVGDDRQRLHGRRE